MEFFIAIIVLVLMVLILFIYYNRFVRLTNQVENSLAQIEVQLRKRADLVPNLISTIKGYAKHEKTMIEKVTEARKALVSAKDITGKIKAGNRLQSALKTIFALAENYPNLKANQNFLHLQQELSAIEDKIAYARQYYNDGIMSYNTLTTTIPGKWFAYIYRFRKTNYLQIPAEAKVVPKVEF